jgi:hypothetical protein
MEQNLPLSVHPTPKWLAQVSALWPGLLVLLVALLLRVMLILQYPLLYDVDAYGRWTTRAQPFNTPWVPLFQVALYLLTRVVDSILAARLLSAFFGATAALAFWLLLRRGFGAGAREPSGYDDGCSQRAEAQPRQAPAPEGAAVAYLGALALAINPLFVTFSVVPYQEGLFFTLAFLALWLALEQGKTRWVWLTIVLALAGLTRYEGWLLSLFIWLLFLWRRQKNGPGVLTWRFAAGSALALAWAPLLWIAINRNVSPDSFQTLEPTLDPTSLLTILHMEWSIWQLNLALAGGALAIGGLLWLLWQTRRGRASDQQEREWSNPERPNARPRRGGNELAWLLLAFLLADLLVLAFLRPFPPGDLRLPLLTLPVIITGVAGLLVTSARLLWRFVGQRLQHVPQRALVAGVLGLATVALLTWYLPLATQRVAGYDAVVLPSYQAADDVGALAHNATMVVIGNNTTFYAFIFYAQQDGWHGQAIQLYAVPATATNLAQALRVSQAGLLVVYSSAGNGSASITTLAQQGVLVADAQGVGYIIWKVQGGPAPGA